MLVRRALLARLGATVLGAAATVHAVRAQSLTAAAASGDIAQAVTPYRLGLIRPALLERARAALARPEIRRTDRLAVVDLAMPSRTPRLFLIDLHAGAVDSFLVAHGKGSDPDHSGVASRFGDVPGSNMTPLGAFAGAERYQGKHGLSLRLDGLDPANANARARAIVLHSEWYVSEDMARTHGKLGRSNGCFVVDEAVLPRVLTAIDGGGLLYADA